MPPKKEPKQPKKPKAKQKQKQKPPQEPAEPESPVPPPETTAAASPYALVPTSAEETADQAVLAFLNDKYQELLKHLRAKYGTDVRVQRLLVNAPPKLSLKPAYAALEFTSFVRGTFYHLTGALEISPRERDGTLRTKPDLLITLVHELSHGMNSFQSVASHGEEFLANFKWLAPIASKELKWDIQVPCWYCDRYGLCRDTFCPTCRHDPPCRDRPQRPETKIPPFAFYPPESRKRVCGAKWPYPWVKAMCAEERVRLSAAPPQATAA